MLVLYQKVMLVLSEISHHASGDCDRSAWRVPRSSCTRSTTRTRLGGLPCTLAATRKRRQVLMGEIDESILCDLRIWVCKLVDVCKHVYIKNAVICTNLIGCMRVRALLSVGVSVDACVYVCFWMHACMYKWCVRDYVRAYFKVVYDNWQEGKI